MVGGAESWGQLDVSISRLSWPSGPDLERPGL